MIIPTDDLKTNYNQTCI